MTPRVPGAMERSRKAVIAAVLVAGVAAFGYTQYASASQIQVSIARSDLVAEEAGLSTYEITLEFDNPSLLALAAGQTTFDILSGGEAVGSGQLEPFTLPPLGKARADGTFETSGDGGSRDVSISGATEYDMLFASVSVPFVHHPTEEQAREFIHRG